MVAVTLAPGLMLLTLALEDAQVVLLFSQEGTYDTDDTDNTDDTEEIGCKRLGLKCLRYESTFP